MAGDWIKMRCNLWDDPRVSRLVDETDSSEAAVIGALYWLWATADQHTEDGVMAGLTLKGIDRKTGVKGFAQALCDIGWLEEKTDGVLLVDFTEHNGTSAKKRCQTAKRVANHTAANGRSTPEPQSANALPSQQDSYANAPLTPEYEATNAHSVSTALAREEKRREEKEETHTAREPAPDEPGGSVCVSICQKMQAAGVKDTNAADPGLAALVGKGAGEAAFVAAAQAAAGQGKGFAYALGIVKNKMTAAASLAAAPLAVPADRPAKPDVSRVTVESNPDVEATQRRLAEAAARPVSAAPPELRARLAQRRQAGVAAGAAAAAGVGVGA